MIKVLVTGATGFMGSALAASFLARSIPVVALSRNDPDGARSVAAIREAARGFGMTSFPAIEEHLQVVDADFSDPRLGLPDAALERITHAWHCAAEMSYSPAKLASSFEVNVGNSTRLFEALCSQIPGFQRFYYVSTAYVAGMDGGVVDEQLHARPRLINPYQMTKWSAEHALHLLHMRTGLPLTIFRPSVVSGHRRTGWAVRNGFGMYMFVDALRAFAAAGNLHVKVDMASGVRPDLISIDQLAADALALTLQGQGRKSLEVFHCTGGRGVSSHALMACFAQATGLAISFGRPDTTRELKFARAIALNMPFANTEWAFSRAGLDRVLGRAAAPDVLTMEEIACLVAWHLDGDAADGARRLRA